MELTFLLSHEMLCFHFYSKSNYPKWRASHLERFCESGMFGISTYFLKLIYLFRVIIRKRTFTVWSSGFDILINIQFSQVKTEPLKIDSKEIGSSFLASRIYTLRDFVQRLTTKFDFRCQVRQYQVKSRWNRVKRGMVRQDRDVVK